MTHAHARTVGDPAAPFRAYGDRTETEDSPQAITSAVFERERGGAGDPSGDFSAAASVPADGEVEFAPSALQMTVPAGTYKWRFACTLPDATVFSTDWEPVEFRD